MENKTRIFDIESFVDKLISLNGATPVWYWDLLDLACGQFSDSVFARMKQVMKNNKFSGVDYMDATNAQKCLEITELFLPLVITQWTRKPIKTSNRTKLY